MCFWTYVYETIGITSTQFEMKEWDYNLIMFNSIWS